MTTMQVAPRIYLYVAEDYDYNTEAHKRQRLTLWSGPFASVYEGDAMSTKTGFMITTADGVKIPVECPNRRADATWQVLDVKLAEAYNDHYSRTHSA